MSYMKDPKSYGITDYAWKDGKLNVYQDVNLSCQNLTELPFNFGTVVGNFHCSFNKLKSLKGSPSKVYGSFNCSENSLTSLRNAPLIVYGSFYCNRNFISSLEGLPKRIDECFNFRNNRIKSIKTVKRLPRCKRIYSDFSIEEMKELIRISNNKDLIKLKMKKAIL